MIATKYMEKRAKDNCQRKGEWNREIRRERETEEREERREREREERVE